MTVQQVYLMTLLFKFICWLWHIMETLLRNNKYMWDSFFGKWPTTPLLFTTLLPSLPSSSLCSPPLPSPSYSSLSLYLQQQQDFRVQLYI